MGFPRGLFNMVKQTYRYSSPVSSFYVLGSAVSTLRCMPYLLQPLVADHEPKSTLTDLVQEGRKGGRKGEDAFSQTAGLPHSAVERYALR